MDFIVFLSMFEGYITTIMAVDHSSNYATFPPKGMLNRRHPKLFFKHVVKYGTFEIYHQCRDSHFTKIFWTELFKLMRLALHFSKSFHPKLIGKQKIECAIKVVFTVLYEH